MRKQSMWNLAATAITLLVLSTSAWADAFGDVYRVTGNLLNAADYSGSGTLLGSFTAPAINFIVPEGQGTSNPLSEFLSSGSASYTSMSNLGDVMSNCPPATTGCYSTAVHVWGVGDFVNGNTYTITHDDGVIMTLDGSPFITAAGPVSAQPDSEVFGGTTGQHSFSIWYMATNGNPEVLQSNIPVPDGGMTLMLLGGVLVGLETLRRKFRA